MYFFYYSFKIISYIIYYLLSRFHKQKKVHFTSFSKILMIIFYFLFKSSDMYFF